MRYCALRSCQLQLGSSRYACPGPQDRSNLAKVCGRRAQKSVLPCFVLVLHLPGHIALYGIWDIVADLHTGDLVLLACSGNSLEVLAKH